MRGKMKPIPVSGIEAVCFDLFFTLADPHCELEHTESAPLGITPAEWGRVTWDGRLGQDRGLGKLKTDREIIERCCALLPFVASEEQKEQVRMAKVERMRLAVTEIAPDIVDTIRQLKERGIKIGLISNADVIDCMYWKESPLAPLFDDVVFSCDVGLLKPEPAIYRRSLERLGVAAEHALFVGDGGSDEHKGAKAVGMKTVCTEELIHYEGRRGRRARKYADYRIASISELLNLIER